MITLTSVAKVFTQLGSASQTNYDRFEVTSFTMDLVGGTISGQCQLLSSANPALSPITGSFVIPSVAAQKAQIALPNLPFFASVALSAPQAAAVAGWLTTAQNSIESGMISIGAIAGTQSAGL